MNIFFLGNSIQHARNSCFQPVPKCSHSRTLLCQTAKMTAWHLSENLRKGKKCYIAAVRKKREENVRETALYIDTKVNGEEELL